MLGSPSGSHNLQPNSSNFLLSCFQNRRDSAFFRFSLASTIPPPEHKLCGHRWDSNPSVTVQMWRAAITLPGPFCPGGESRTHMLNERYILGVLRLTNCGTPGKKLINIPTQVPNSVLNLLSVRTRLRHRHHPYLAVTRTTYAILIARTYPRIIYWFSRTWRHRTAHPGFWTPAPPWCAPCSYKVNYSLRVTSLHFQLYVYRLLIHRVSPIIRFYYYLISHFLLGRP